jgi:transcriptional regulator with XRE-family HTH domain
MIGRRLLEIRKKKRLSQTELANLTGIKQQSISLYERGLQNASDENIVRICLALDVSADNLLGIQKKKK